MVLAGLEMRFPSRKAYFNLTMAINMFSLLRRCIQLNVLSIFQLRGLFVEIFLQIGPWTPSGYNFLLVTPFNVNPKPISLFHRAHSVGHTFTMC